MTTAVRTPHSRCRFGIAIGDVTPPVGMYHRMWGAATHDVSTGVHNPLRATAVVFGPQEGNELRVLVALDHCVLGVTEVDALLETIEERCEVPPEDVFVTCSHTHAAGLLSLDRIDMPGGDLLPEYLAGMTGTVAELVEKARESVQPAWIVYGTGRCDLAAHRDFFDEKAGRRVCGFDPDTPADDTVLVARVASDDGTTLASLVNYACHPTTLAWDNTLISPDFPGATREVVEDATGAPCLFLQGASGELGPREGFVGDPAVADRNGRQLGHAALAAIEALPEPGTEFAYAGPVESGATIGTWKRRAIRKKQRTESAEWSARELQIELPYRDDLESIKDVERSLHELEREERTARDAGREDEATDLRARAERKRRALARHRVLPTGDTFPYRCVVWRMGEAVWVGVQGEPYSLLQTELRARFPDTPLVVASIGYAWSVSYLPPRESYGKGLYQESIAVVAPGSLESLIEELASAIERTFG